MKPRRLSVENSAMKVAAPPYSPPVEALHEAGDEQQHGRHDADRRVAGDQADRERADGHHDHRGGEHALAADAVAERAEHHAAERAHEERGRERAEVASSCADGLLDGKNTLPSVTAM